MVDEAGAWAARPWASMVSWDGSTKTMTMTKTNGGEGEARIPPFDAVAFDIGALWDVNPPAGQTP